MEEKTDGEMRETAVKDTAVKETAVTQPSTTLKENKPELATTPANPTDGALTLQMIQTHWRELVNRAAQQNKNMPALLGMGKPLGVEGNTAVIGFDYPIFRQKFEDTRGAAQLLADILSQLTGHPCHIRAVNTSDYTVPVDPKEFRAIAEEFGGVVSED